MITDDTETMTVPEAARSLGVIPDAVRKAIGRGRLRATAWPIPGQADQWQYRIAVVEVERYRAEHRKPRRAT